MPELFRVSCIRVVRTRQTATWTGEAENSDDAIDLAEQASDAGNLSWIDDDNDIPVPDEDAYEFEAEEVDVSEQHERETFVPHPDETP